MPLPALCLVCPPSVRVIPKNGVNFLCNMTVSPFRFLIRYLGTTFRQVEGLFSTPICHSEQLCDRREQIRSFFDIFANL